MPPTHPNPQAAADQLTRALGEAVYPDMEQFAFMPNRCLIGQPGSRAALDTPALVVDIEAFDRNVAKMAESPDRRRRASAASCSARPTNNISAPITSASAPGLLSARHFRINMAGTS